MLADFTSFFSSQDFMPHGHCFLWLPRILWLHVVSDALIAGAYYAIPLSLLYFIRNRKDMPFQNLFYLFGAFILLCGTTHIMAIWVIWHADYGTEGVLKALTALASVVTAFVSWKIIPRALDLKGPGELEKLNIQLQRAYEEIEDKVEIRTSELTEVNARLKQSQNELEAALAVAREASTAKSDFLANMSHEIRTPMNAIVGLANLLQNEKIAPHKQKEFINTMQISAQSLMSLLNDLLDITKLESEAVTLEQTAFNFAQLADEVIRILSVPAKAKGIELYKNFENIAERAFIGDPLRLRQILTNLVSNAIKFTEKGTVTLHIQAISTADKERMNLHIDVIDTGVGIPADKIEAIFDKFSQADSSISRRFGGSGLGLSICKTLVTLMGGTISVRSSIGLGSKFEVEIPLVTADRMTGSGNEKPAATDSSENITLEASGPLILLVEDHPANILVASAIIEGCGYRWETASNGQEALEKFKANHYDLVLMDLQLPAMDGLTAAKAMRDLEAKSKNKPTPIIGVTAYSLAGDRERFTSAGMNDYLAKPYNPEELKAKMKNFLATEAPA